MNDFFKAPITSKLKMGSSCLLSEKPFLTTLMNESVIWGSSSVG